MTLRPGTEYLIIPLVTVAFVEPTGLGPREGSLVGKCQGRIAIEIGPAFHEGYWEKDNLGSTDLDFKQFCFFSVLGDVDCFEYYFII